MSYVLFNDTLDRLILMSATGVELGRWHANNNVASNREKWPPGRYRYSHWMPHSGASANSAYGQNGNFVFAVPGRSGMGIHSGRASVSNNPGPDHPTYGCIRTTDAATAKIREIHAADPLTHIVVSR